MARKNLYRLQVNETNVIAGETIVGKVTVKGFKLLSQARDYAEMTWKGYPPAGARIIDKDENVYSVPSF